MGGAIKDPKQKKRKKDPKIEEALETQARQMGGRIPKKNPKRVEPRRQKRDEIEPSIFHNPTHRYLHGKLSGRGGSMDTPFCRAKMHQLMSRYHPAFFQTYLTGRVNHLRDEYHERAHPAPRKQPVEPRPTYVDMGGSLRSVSHSEAGLLQSYDSTFHHHLELI